MPMIELLTEVLAQWMSVSLVSLIAMAAPRLHPVTGNPLMGPGGGPSHGENCCCDPTNCDPVCATGTVPETYSVEISGIVDGGSCPRCEDINGTYLIDLLAPLTNPCLWQITSPDFDFPCGTGTLNDLIVEVRGNWLGTGVAVFVYISRPSSPNTIWVFKVVTGEDVDCGYPEELEVPFSEHTAGPGGCDFDLAIATLTAA